MNKIITTAMALTAFLTAGCSSDSPENVIPDSPAPSETRPEWTVHPLSEVAPHNVGKTNGFAFNLFKTVYEEKKENPCLSPASVFMTLAMLANGDQATARDEITEVLGYGTGEEALDELNVFCNALLTEVPRTEAPSRLTLSNSLWYEPEVRIDSYFADMLTEVYSVSLFPARIREETGMNMINDFVSDHTEGLITNFLKQPMRASVILLNTVWFKGCWENPFDERLTLPGDFHNLDGSTGTAQFMNMDGEMEYAEIDGITAVRLPYKGDRFTMTLMLPTDGTDFNAMPQDLTAERLAKIDDALHPEEIILSLPRFEGEVNTELVEILKKMGISYGCDVGYSRITDEVYRLRQFKHAVKILVDEKGTEAAAASAAGLENCPPPLVRFNSPYIYLIRDGVSGTILFIGAVTKF